MALTSNHRFLADHQGNTSNDPNLFSADEIVAYAGVTSGVVSTVTSQVVSTAASGALDSVPVSSASSRAVSAALNASIADSKAVSVSVNTSVADSKAVSVSLNCSKADSKAVSVAAMTIVVTSPSGTYLASGTGATLRAISDKLGEIISVKDYGALGDGVTDDAAAICKAITAANSGTYPNGGVFFPRGTYVIGSQITCANPRTHLYGEVGPYGTNIYFNQTGTCFLFEGAHSGSPLYQCSVRNLSFLSTDTTHKKIAIDCVDCSSMVIENVTVNSWNGLKSTGIRFAGRDLARFRDLSIYADRPIEFVANAQSPTLGMDHLHLTDMELSCQDTAEYCIAIGDNMAIFNFTIDGRNSGAGGLGYLKYAPTAAPSTNIAVNISNIRYETPTGNGSFAIEWGSSAVTTRNFNLHGCNLGGTSGTVNTNKGLKLRGVYTASINGIYTGGNVGLDVDSSCHDLLINQFVVVDGSTTPVSITGLTKIFASNYPVGGYGTPVFAYYINSTDATSPEFEVPLLMVTPGSLPGNLRDGMLWTTTAGLFTRINGVTKTVTLT